jgi:hypothetical protein
MLFFELDDVVDGNVADGSIWRAFELFDETAVSAVTQHFDTGDEGAIIVDAYIDSIAIGDVGLRNFICSRPAVDDENDAALSRVSQ